MATYVARFSNHIEEDIRRGWSSFNFGEEGFHGTYEELMERRQKAFENDEEFYISGVYLTGNDILKADIRELYEDYWVLVDDVNAPNGLSCIELEATNLEDAIEEAQKRSYDYCGWGSSFNPKEAKLVWSNDSNEIHIFEIDE